VPASAVIPLASHSLVRPPRSILPSRPLDPQAGARSGGQDRPGSGPPKAWSCRVDEDVAILIPHSPGCADFPLPVLHGRASLAVVERAPAVTHRSRISRRQEVPPRFRSCRFSYPLSFRAQVCEAQSSLPCCPSAVLSSRRPPSLGWVPVSPVPQRRQYYEGATTSHPASPVTYLFRFRGPRDPSLLRARCCQRSRADGGSDRARTIVQPAVLFAGSLSRGREWDLSGSQATHPVPLPRSKTPAEPTFPRQ
jgi:hypothetical protein